MKRNLRTLQDERGQILVLSAFVIVSLLAFTGLIIDVGFLYAEHRQAQNAADEAAWAAAFEIYNGGSVADATTAALAYADENGFDNSGGSSTVTVNIPPASGEHVGDPNYVEVIVSDKPTTFFIHVVIPDGSTVQARGVAGVVIFPEPYALVVLDTDDCQAYRQQGTASLTIHGGGVMINSDCQTNALSKGGSGSLIVDGTIDVHGGYNFTGSGPVSPEPRTVYWTVDDPLRSVLPPPLGSPAPGSPGTAENPDTWRVTSGGDFTLYPGTYYGGFYSNCTCTITMEPGVYVMAGGGFTKGGGATFTGDGVTIYLTENPTNPTGDGAPEPFSLTGSGALDLSPPTSGLYQGITLWQDEAITEDFTMRGSNDLVSGILYAPGATLDFAGDTQAGTVQIIVNGFYLHGNSPLDLTYGEFRDADVPRVVLVE